jgi:hypothetical protein
MVVQVSVSVFSPASQPDPEDRKPDEIKVKLPMTSAHDGPQRVGCPENTRLNHEVGYNVRAETPDMRR